MKPRLLLISSNSPHLINYYHLIKDYFSEILVITNSKLKDENITHKVLNFSLKQVSNLYYTPREIKKISDEFVPDIVHVHQANVYSFYTLLALKNSSIPKIITLWGSDVLIIPKRNILLKKIVQYILKNGDAFTTDAKFMVERTRKLYPKKNVEILVANFGISIKQVNFPKENMIYSNRLHNPLYRIDLIIKAFSKFCTNEMGKNYKLIIAATGSETDKLQALTRDLKISHKVNFVGWVDTIKNAEYYSKAKIFVSIPESDATAISLLEAMTCGCLPLLSDLPANKEWVQDAINGLIITDLTSNFFSRISEIDFDKSAELNKIIVAKEGTKEVNKMKFYALYDKFLKSK